MRRLFVLVAAVILVDMMFYAAISPLLPEYSHDLGLSKSEAGILSASFAAGVLIAALPSGWLAAWIGVRQSMLVGLALLSGSSFAFAFAGDVVALDVARFAQGVGSACAWTGGLAWVLAAGPRERRGELVGSVIAVAIMGSLLGPVLGGAATELGPELVFSVVGAIAAALAVWVLATPGVEPGAVPGFRRVIAAIATAPVMLAFWFVVLPSALSGLLNVLAPLRLDALGASGLAIGAVYLTSAATEGILSPSIGRLSDRRGRMFPIVAGLAATVAMALLAPVPKSVLLLAATVVAVVLAMSLIWTPAMALLSDNAEAAGLDLAFATALVNLSWAGGQVLGGSFGARLADATTDATAYSVVASMFALTLVALLARRRFSAVPHTDINGGLRDGAAPTRASSQL